ncbi:hypothetical protein ACFE04_020585 [Oxalis oulophora]
MGFELGIIELYYGGSIITDEKAESSKKNDVNEDENNGGDGPGLDSSVGVEENSEKESDGREESEVLVDLSDGDDDDDDKLQKARSNLNLQRKIRRNSGINGLLEVLRDIHGIATRLDKTSNKSREPLDLEDGAGSEDSYESDVEENESPRRRRIQTGAGGTVQTATPKDNQAGPSGSGTMAKPSNKGKGLMFVMNEGKTLNTPDVGTVQTGAGGTVQTATPKDNQAGPSGSGTMAKPSNKGKGLMFVMNEGKTLNTPDVGTEKEEAVCGHGLYIDPVTGKQTMHPGMPSEHVIAEGSNTNIGWENGVRPSNR